MGLARSLNYDDQCFVHEINIANSKIFAIFTDRATSRSPLHIII